jgi:hypothetical protein
MADPLTALIHAVQVMNFLKTLILKTVNKREEAAMAFPSDSDSPNVKDEPQILEHLDVPFICSCQRNADSRVIDGVKLNQILFRMEEELLHHDMQGCTGGPNNHDNTWGHEKCDGEISQLEADLSTQINSPANDFSNDNEDGLFDKFKRNRAGRLCRHPVFQFSRSMKKSDETSQACV